MPKTKTAKTHPADRANRDDVRAAASFNVHLRLSPTAKINESAATLSDAISKAAAIRTKHPNRTPLIYAITADGRTALVPPDTLTAAQPPMFEDDFEPPKFLRRDDPPAAVDDGPSVSIADPEPETHPIAAANATSAPAKGKRAATVDAAKSGQLPAPPDFSKPTHARFRPKLARLIEMAEVGDIAGLKATAINPISSSPKAMARYRDLAVIALEARTAS